jgi:hypothetical protein
MTVKGMAIAFCCLVALVAVNCRDAGDIERQGERAAAEISANERLAGPVLMAIGRYEADHGCATDDLGSLVPAYLAAIPKTVGSQGFRYELHDIDRYYLCFDVLSDPTVGCCYYGRLESWDCSMRATH